MIRLYGLNDTIIMNYPTRRQQKFLLVFLKKDSLSSSRAYEEITALEEAISLVTVKRTLSDMVKNDFLLETGSGRSTKYSIGIVGRLFADVNAKEYCSIEPDRRYGLKKYNFELVQSMPPIILNENELTMLGEATAVYNQRTENLPADIQKRELERLIIELSWKSSKIEGNTYTLLDTEKLILENKEAVGHDKKEAQMILNHKDAFNFIHENSARFKTLTKQNMEELHGVIVKDLSIETGLRHKAIGITGSTYQPLDNVYQITEAVQVLEKSISDAASPYAKALIALLGISYIQPFNDGNKRTARLMANALLLSHGLAPLSYRSVDETEYRESTLVFYELNSIISFKKIFIDQYVFAAKNYAVK